MNLDNYRIYSDKELHKPYVTSGRQVYMVGRQDGGFIQTGEHIPGEMHGVWHHPNKWLDGFWFYINGEPLTDKAVGFESLPYGSGHECVLDDQTKVKRFQFCLDTVAGLVIELIFENPGDGERRYSLDWVVRSELIQVWDYDWDIEGFGQDRACYDSEFGGFLFSPSFEGEHVACLSLEKPVGNGISTGFDDVDHTPGKGISAKLTYDVLIPAGASVTVKFAVVGSAISDKDAAITAEQVLGNADAHLAEKKSGYEEVHDRSKMTLPDTELETVYQWTKWHIEWLTREVEGFGQGLGAGIPEYPWWFGCDSYYALLGALAAGFHDLAKNTLNLLRDFSMHHNGNGRIAHEITTAGKVVNPGNTQETANYIVAVYRTFEYTGDIVFLKAHFDYMKLGIQWLYETMDDDGDMLPSGYGITEIEGLNVELIDTAVYGCEALTVMAEAGKLFNDEMAETYRAMAARARKVINETMFMEGLDLYADAVTTPRMILSRIDKMITRMYELEKVPEAGESLKAMKKDFEKMPPDDQVPVSIFKNWAINTPMETGIADRQRAIRALEAMDSETFIGPHGIYLSGLMRTHQMTISTGVQAVAEARYGRTDKALERMKQITGCFSVLMPGSITEMSPDYGCYVQAWTIYGLAVPIIQHFFGIQPDAYHRRIIIRPNLPKNWDRAKLENMVIGDTTIAIEVTPKTYEITVDERWQVDVSLDLEDSRKVIINNQRRIISSFEDLL